MSDIVMGKRNGGSTYQDAANARPEHLRLVFLMKRLITGAT